MTKRHDTENFNDFLNTLDLIWKRDFFCIVLTGSVGSGKSLARNYFKQLGAKVLDADEVAKSCFKKKEVQEQILQVFPTTISLKKESIIIDTSKLANIVFEKGNDIDLKKLNAIVHPQVASVLNNKIKLLQAGDIFIYDVPLFFETRNKEDYRKNWDLFLCISAKKSIRKMRTIQNRNWSQEEWGKREAKQMNYREKEKLSDLVIANDHTEEEFFQKLQLLYKKIKKSSPIK